MRGKKFFPFRVDPILKGLCCPGKQTGCHKSYFPSKQDQSTYRIACLTMPCPSHNKVCHKTSKSVQRPMLTSTPTSGWQHLPVLLWRRAKNVGRHGLVYPFTLNASRPDTNWRCEDKAIEWTGTRFQSSQRQLRMGWIGDTVMTSSVISLQLASLRE